MDDLASAMAGEEDVLMLGGGNPAHIPEILAFFQDRLQRIAQRPAELAQIIGNYSSPGGDKRFISALAELIREHYGWDISARNIALTAGSQASFFLLFNTFAGEFTGGRKSRCYCPWLLSILVTRK